MQINRAWEMPNSNTFDIKCIHKLIERYKPGECHSIDPFSNKNRIAKHTNDIDPQYFDLPTSGSHSCMDALKWLKIRGNNTADLVLFDPPYSTRQIAECYKKVGMTVNMETTQSSYWSKLKKEIARVVRPGGIVISFAWNTCGIGVNLGFEIVEILLVCHGGWHNDTIVTVERKIQDKLF